MTKLDAELLAQHILDSTREQFNDTESCDCGKTHRRVIPSGQVVLTDDQGEVLANCIPCGADNPWEGAFFSLGAYLKADANNPDTLQVKALALIIEATTLEVPLASADTVSESNWKDNPNARPTVLQYVVTEHGIHGAVAPLLRGDDGIQTIGEWDYESPAAQGRAVAVIEPYAASTWAYFVGAHRPDGLEVSQKLLEELRAASKA